MLLFSTPPSERAEPTIELFSRARAGDREALDRLLARCLPRLRRWARGRLPARARGRVDTDDLIQETVMRTLRRLDSLEAQQSGAIDAYLRQALLNRIRDEIRGAGRWPEASELPADAVDPGPSPLDAAIGEEAVRRYESALARLTETERAAVIARVELGASYEEIMQALDKPSVGAARMAVARALLRLAQEMSG